MKLQEHMIVPKRRTSSGSLVLGLLLLGAGYWTTCSAITLWHRGISKASAYIIQTDIAQTGLKGKLDERVAYSTALKLDSCMERLEQVRESIIDIPNQQSLEVK